MSGGHPVTSVVWAFFSVNLTAQQLEDPFGLDPNDLPLDAFSDEIRNCVAVLDIPGPMEALASTAHTGEHSEEESVASQP